MLYHDGAWQGVPGGDASVCHGMLIGASQAYLCTSHLISLDRPPVHAWYHVRFDEGAAPVLLPQPWRTAQTWSCLVRGTLLECARTPTLEVLAPFERVPSS